MRYSTSIRDKQPSINDVRDYWEHWPLLSHEVGNVAPIEHWKLLDVAKRTDVERFSLEFWGFDQVKGLRLLDIGCGPGWLTVKYAQAGAEVTAIDLTDAAVRITKSVLTAMSVDANVQVANAECLPFDNESFEIVVSSGVLHHTPDPMKGFSEAFRVTVPGGIGRITLYRLSLLHHPLVFPIVKVLLRATRTRHPGADLAAKATSVGEFVRMYDGEQNPIGVARTTRQWRRELSSTGWEIVSSEVHYFPLRMVGAFQALPRWVHYLLDHFLGTMTYFELRKPVTTNSSEV